MTTTTPFRTCRPFSLLLQSSDEFLDAQSNLTLLNTLIWGTCNPPPGKDQCVQNMQWFASTLNTACEQDLRDRNALAVNTLTALQAYEVMYDSGCLTDPTTNSYCFVNAARNPTPSDLYFYQLPLGTSLPKRTTPSCSGCTRSLLGVYAAALQNDGNLDGLEETYQGAADAAAQACGVDYAQTSLSNGVVRTLGAPDLLLGCSILVAWMLLEHR